VRGRRNILRQRAMGNFAPRPHWGAVAQKSKIFRTKRERGRWKTWALKGGGSQGASRGNLNSDHASLPKTLSSTVGVQTMISPFCEGKKKKKKKKKAEKTARKKGGTFGNASRKKICGAGGIAVREGSTTPTKRKKERYSRKGDQIPWRKGVFQDAWGKRISGGETEDSACFSEMGEIIGLDKFAEEELFCRECVFLGREFPSCTLGTQSG